MPRDSARLLEALGGKYVQPVCVRVLLIVVVLKHRAGDVGTLILIGHVAVHHAEARLSQMFPKPGGVRQVLRMLKVGSFIHAALQTRAAALPVQAGVFFCIIGARERLALLLTTISYKIEPEAT